MVMNRSPAKTQVVYANGVSKEVDAILLCSSERLDIIVYHTREAMDCTSREGVQDEALHFDEVVF
jgi:hypothetical protein